MLKGQQVGPNHPDYLQQTKELTEYYDQIDEAKKKQENEFKEYLAKNQAEKAKSAIASIDDAEIDF